MSDGDGGKSEGSPRAETVRRAVTEVRREVLKAVAVESVVEGTVIALAVALVAAVSGVGSLVRPVGPATVGDFLGAVAGVGYALGAVVVRTRTPAVERFEGVNPAVAEALRTARDAAECDREGRVVRALYEDVLDGLGEASSRGLVAWRRVAGAVVLVGLLSVAAVGVAAVGVDGGVVTDRSPTGNTEPTDATPAPAGTGSMNDTGLEPGADVLGEPTNVSAGDRNLTAEVGTGPGGRGDRDRDRAYDASGFDTGGDDVETERAGYVSADPPAEADLIREYTLALRENEDATDDTT
jgi:hypothetical protein